MKLKTIVVDDEQNILAETKRALARNEEVEVIGDFISPVEALKFAHNNEINLAVLDIEMTGISGMDLAEMMKNLYPDIQIIFATGYDCYAVAAYQLQAMAYLMKPYSFTELDEAIRRCKLQLGGLHISRQESKVQVRTFGNFDVYVSGEVLFFGYGKAKELFAFLVNARGGTVTMEQVITALWENRPYDNRVKQLYRKAVSVMRTTFRNAGVEELCYYYRSCLAANVKAYDCDYEDFLNGSVQSGRNYMEDYMTEYSWAEERNAFLSNIINVGD